MLRTAIAFFLLGWLCCQPLTVPDAPRFTFPHPHQLNQFGGIDIRFVADGDRILYGLPNSSIFSQSTTLYSQSLGDGAPIPLTLVDFPTTSSNLNYAISPDGSQVAVVGRPLGTPSATTPRSVWLAPADGSMAATNVSAIAESVIIGFQVRFSVDGRFVLYSAYPEGSLAVGLMRVPTDGTQTPTLVAVEEDANEIRLDQALWDAENNIIYGVDQKTCITCTETELSLYAVPEGGASSDSIRFAHHVDNVTWSDDLRNVFVWADMDNNTLYELWQFQATDYRTGRLLWAPTSSETGSGCAGSNRILTSTTGDIVVICYSDNASVIHTTTPTSEPTPLPSALPNSNCDFLSIAHDGSAVIVVCRADAGYFYYYLVSTSFLNTPPPEYVAGNKNAGLYAIRFSRDSRFVTFSRPGSSQISPNDTYNSYDRTNRAGHVLWIMTQGDHSIPNPGAFTLSESPDTMFFESDGFLMVAPLDPTNGSPNAVSSPYRVSDNQALEYAVSPDGHTVVFEHNRSLYAVDAGPCTPTTECFLQSYYVHLPFVLR